MADSSFFCGDIEGDSDVGVLDSSPATKELDGPQANAS